MAVKLALDITVYLYVTDGRKQAGHALYPLALQASAQARVLHLPLAFLLAFGFSSDALLLGACSLGSSAFCTTTRYCLLYTRPGDLLFFAVDSPGECCPPSHNLLLYLLFVSNMQHHSAIPGAVSEYRGFCYGAQRHGLGFSLSLCSVCHAWTMLPGYLCSYNLGNATEYIKLTAALLTMV